MKQKTLRVWIAACLFSGILFAAETDAEIIRDLDFFMNVDVVREDAVFDDSMSDQDYVEVATTPDAAHADLKASANEEN